MESPQLRSILEVSDFDRSLAFYRDTLGLAEMKRWPGGDDQGPGAILKIGRGKTLELFGPPMDRSFPTPVGVKLAIEVDDAAAEHARLVAAGAAVFRGLVENPWGDLSFGIEDPDGVQIWLFEVIEPEDWQIHIR